MLKVANRKWKKNPFNLIFFFTFQIFSRCFHCLVELWLAIGLRHHQTQKSVIHQRPYYKKHLYMYIWSQRENLQIPVFPYLSWDPCFSGILCSFHLSTLAFLIKQTHQGCSDLNFLSQYQYRYLKFWYTWCRLRCPEYRTQRKRATLSPQQSSSWTLTPPLLHLFTPFHGTI